MNEVFDFYFSSLFPFSLSLFLSRAGNVGSLTGKSSDYIIKCPPFHINRQTAAGPSPGLHRAQQL